MVPEGLHSYHQFVFCTSLRIKNLFFYVGGAFDKAQQYASSHATSDHHLFRNHCWEIKILDVILMSIIFHHFSIILVDIQIDFHSF